METSDLLPLIVGTIFSPPGIIIVIALFGFIVHLRWSLLGAAVLSLSIALLIGISLPITAHQLTTGIESYARPTEGDTATGRTAPQAIVVLGDGRRADTPEYDGDTVNAVTLERLRYAAALQRKTGLPIICSGGSRWGENTPESELMRQVLTEDFHAQVTLLESRSRSTMDSARYTHELLAGAGIQKVYLVTHAWHMRRAMWAHQNNGTDVIPAATGFSSLGREGNSAAGYLPSAVGMNRSAIALRERISFLWYTFSKPAAQPSSRPAMADPAPSEPSKTTK